VITLITALEEANLRLVSALEIILPAASGTPPDGGPPDLRAARDVIRAIEALLAADDVQATSVFSENASLLRAVLGSPAREIERLVAGFEFDAALLRLRLARQAHPELAED